MTNLKQEAAELLKQLQTRGTTVDLEKITELLEQIALAPVPSVPGGWERNIISIWELVPSLSEIVEILPEGKWDLLQQALMEGSKKLLAAAAPAAQDPVASLPVEWRQELLDWVSACQSSYHIESTPGHRFGGIGSNLEENRKSLIEYVEGLLAASPKPHPDDIAVDLFAAFMKAKMAKQRAKGYSGWNSKTECPPGVLQRYLAEHVTKGDPIDVGNLAMMLWNRGEKTTPAHAKPAVPAVKLPACEDEAAGMVLVGTKWLEQYAPHRLKTQALTTPDGWRPVPVEPSQNMLEEGYEYTYDANVKNVDESDIAGIYRAMLAAAPEAPAAQIVPDSLRKLRGTLDAMRLSYNDAELRPGLADAIEQLEKMLDAAALETPYLSQTQQSERQAGLTGADERQVARIPDGWRRSVEIALAALREQDEWHKTLGDDTDAYGDSDLEEITRIGISRLEQMLSTQKAPPVNADGERAANLLSALVSVRNALGMANEEKNGPIRDTIWMPNGPETLFDFIDAAIAAEKGDE